MLLLYLLGVRYLVLSWFTSYLSYRSSSVKIYNYFSSPSSMKYGVPQRSVLGPSLFYIYLYPLPSLISITINMQMKYYYICFFQLIYNQVLISNSPIVLMILKNIYNNLLLNTSKTTLLNLSPSPNYLPHFLIDNTVIYPSPTASNLGVHFLILLPSLNLQIIIYLKLKKYEN